MGKQALKKVWKETMGLMGVEASVGFDSTHTYVLRASRKSRNEPFSSFTAGWMEPCWQEYTLSHTVTLVSWQCLFICSYCRIGGMVVMRHSCKE